MNDARSATSYSLPSKGDGGRVAHLAVRASGFRPSVNAVPRQLV